MKSGEIVDQEQVSVSRALTSELRAQKGQGADFIHSFVFI